MLIYKDTFTGDEVASDSYPSAELDGVVLQMEGKFILKGGEDFGIENNDEEGAGVEDTQEKVINIVDVHRLQEQNFTKKQYGVYIKGYMKRLKAHLEEKNPDRVAPFMKGAATFVKKVLSEFNEYTFYSSESLDPDAMVILCKWSEDGMTPYFQYFKDGLDEEKY
eukprot:TRINITY_DN23315_c0_g1_i1.p2 TRINITY_DN23315_c0_g1~~TRINITY_DN23315_c0_g1_i1.p2  ORF type:complete len:178 (+),score=70.54 TRINITY_DN23315_c0_g1_i1:42-536(+)